jgi:hypothetical protein
MWHGFTLCVHPKLKTGSLPFHLDEQPNLYEMLDIHGSENLDCVLLVMAS